MRIFLFLVCLISLSTPMQAQNAPRPNSPASGIMPAPRPLPTPRPTPIPTPTPVPLTMFPFALPPFDASKTAVDVSWMNTAPAGANGFIQSKGEHFVDGKGNIVRFWGVNLNFVGVFPSKAEAPKIAARLAKFGFNAARIHHFEGNAAPNGIWKVASIGSSRLKMPREIDPEQLDRLDFFMAELIKHGIYINFNLHVGRKALDDDGVLQAGFLPEKDKGVNLYDEKLIELQEEFARTLLTHVNPYTGRAYKDEPGVNAIEVVNENSLLGLWLESKLNTLPEYYERDLQEKWNEWLREKYKTDQRWRLAWTELDDPLHGADLMAQPYPFDILNPNAPDARVRVGMASLGRMQLATTGGGVGRIEVDSLSGHTNEGFARPGLRAHLTTTGSVAWAYQLQRDGLDLVENQPYTLSFWARSNTRRRISVNLWQDRPPHQFGGFTGYADLTPTWRKFTYIFRPADPDPGHSRLSWNLGSVPGMVDLSEVTLYAGGRLAPPNDWSLLAADERAPDGSKSLGIPVLELRTTPLLVARRDFAEFLIDVESTHLRRMRRLLKEELGVRVPVWQTQAQFGGWGGLWRERESDAIDVHAYWKHPDFSGGTAWGANWRVENASMTRAPAIDPMSGFALFRLPGKPFVMTEWNSGQPNDFGAESLLMLASYAAWQDWAAIYLFDYHSSGSYNREHYQGFFSIDTHPVKMATAPAAAMMFRRPTTGLPGDVAAARNAVTLTLPRDNFWFEVVNMPGPPLAAPAVSTWRSAGAWRGAPLQSKAYTTFGDVMFPTASHALASNAEEYSADTGQVQWRKNPGLFTVNTPRSKSVMGFLGGREIALDELRVQMPSSHNDFVSLSLSSLDGKAVASSERLLLTVAGRAENIGMGWNAARNSVGNQWGRGPTQVEGITTQIALVTEARSAQVWALDNTGARRMQVSSTLQGGVLRFWTAPRWQTLWYEIVRIS